MGTELACISTVGATTSSATTRSLSRSILLVHRVASNTLSRDLYQRTRRESWSSRAAAGGRSPHSTLAWLTAWDCSSRTGTLRTTWQQEYSLCTRTQWHPVELVDQWWLCFEWEIRCECAQDFPQFSNLWMAWGFSSKYSRQVFRGTRLFYLLVGRNFSSPQPAVLHIVSEKLSNPLYRLIHRHSTLRFRA